MAHRGTAGRIATLALLAVLGGERTGISDVVTEALVDNGATSVNAKYEVTFENDDLAVNYNPADQNMPGPGVQQGTVTVSTTWDAGEFDSRTVKFTQMLAPAGEFGVMQGLRLQVVLSLTNDSGKAWSRFTVAAEDNSVPNPLAPGTPGNGSHDRRAHFHPNTGGLMFAPGSGLTTPDDFNNVLMFQVRGGQQASNSTLGISRFFLHERNLRTVVNNQPVAVTREFTLILTPQAVPEPSTLALAALGGLGLVGVMRRRRAG